MNDSLPSETDVHGFLDAIHVRYHYDFRHYALASVKRRLRAAQIAMNVESLASLEQQVLAEPSLFTKLLQYLTVQTSEMFRDPSFFAALRTRIAPVLMTYPSLKIWVAGCSTGEELYSICILLREEALLERSIIYATDINPEALRRAEAGIYPIARAPAFTENHRASGGKGSLSDYYSAAYGSIVFDRSLRRNVVFSDHSLATDSVFAEVQVVTCRNVLIYFDRTLQDRALGLMHDALCRRGFLGLGTKESVRFSSYSTAFSELVPGERWFQKC
ncbi:MAG TPA: CheR family methyltransferase [Polyangiaceae bacterium]|jgi:chemotaxis protein methyltransferase CheR|nr:CheR family methyltransferase [Polyangiaceae bacterium]